MATILEFDPQTATSLATALGSHSVTLVDAAQVVPTVSATGDSLVVIGPSVDEQVASRVTQSLMAAFPSGGVIWLRRRIDTAVVLAAVRSGAADVVAETALPELVAAASRVVERAHHMAAQVSGSRAEASRGATVTAIYAAKGGCGKTSVASNLAALLSNEMHQRVCLMDLDLESGDVQLLMGLPRGRSILDLVDLESSLDAASLTACLQQHSSGVYVLSAPRRPEEAAVITSSLVAKILAVASNMFDQIIIDCPPYATEHVLSVFDAADHLGLVCTPDAAGVKNTAIALEVLKELSMEIDVSLMINHAGDPVGITTADIAEALQTPVKCEIPSSLDLPSATNSAKLLSLSQPKHPITNAIRAWAQTINPTPTNVAIVPDQRTAPAKAKRHRLFGKRVATA